jgi:membrane protein DedA with SNARE-associated domain
MTAAALASGSPPLPGFLDALASPLQHYGLWAIGFLVLVEDFGIPVPGETILIAAALYAGAGRLNVVAVGVVAFIAAVIGDNIGFAIGHFGGRALALRWGKYVHLTEARLDRAEHFFARHGGKIITISRFVEGLRQANGIIAGVSGMHWRRFLAFNALGAALWVGAWVSIGYLAGNHITAIYNDITKYSYYLLGAVVVLVVGYIVWRVRGRHRHRTPTAASTAKEASTAEASTAEASETEEDELAEEKHEAAHLVEAVGVTPTGLTPGPSDPEAERPAEPQAEPRDPQAGPQAEARDPQAEPEANRA